MSNAVDKLSKLENCKIDVRVEKVGEEFLGTVQLVTFNPDKFVTNGGPITVKDLVVRALGKDYDNAYNNVLERAVTLFGL